MADMSPMAEELDANHNDSHHSPANSVGSSGSSGGGGGGGIPMLVVHKREIVSIMDEQHGHHENNHHMDDDDQHAIDDQDTDGDALSPQKRPLNNNNNDVATVFLIDASDVEGAHEGHDGDPAVDVAEVSSQARTLSRLSYLAGTARDAPKCHQLFRMPV